MQYEIGQIVYLLNRDEMKIIPVQVIEQVTKKSLNADTDISYTVSLPNKTRTQASLNDLDADVFTSINEIRMFMIENATMNIQKMVSKAEEVAKYAFANENKVQQNLPGVE